MRDFVLSAPDSEHVRLTAFIVLDAACKAGNLPGEWRHAASKVFMESLKGYENQEAGILRKRIAALETEARRFYYADRSDALLDTPEEVIEKRRAAAVENAKLRAVRDAARVLFSGGSLDAGTFRNMTALHKALAATEGKAGE